jgi:hypothetical protein
MPAPVEFTVTASALTAGFAGDPQEFFDAMVARLTITPSEPWSSFINGGAEPTSDVGPWLRLGQEWRVWDTGLGAYTYHVQNGAGIVDGTITAAKFAPGAIGASSIADGSLTEPKFADDSVSTRTILDLNVTTAKLAASAVTTAKILDANVTLAKLANGTAKGVLTYSAAGAPTVTAAGTDGWVLTQSASGPVFTALPAATPFAVYPAQAELTAGPQVITLGAAATKCTLNVAPYNPTPVPFDTANSRYVAPATGAYVASCIANFSNNTGTVAGMEITLRMYVTGVDSGVFVFTGIPSPNSDRWSLTIPAQVVSLSATNYIEFFVEATDGVDAGNIHLTSIDASFFRVN